MDNFIRFPWAVTGDKRAIPAEAQADGEVSWPTGWTVDYERNPTTDQQAKLIPRDQFNQAMFVVSSAVREIQVRGLPSWISPEDNGGAAFSYAVGAMLSYGNKVYVNTLANNTAEPGGAGWAELQNFTVDDITASATEVNAGNTSVTGKFVSPATLRAGVSSTVLTGFSVPNQGSAVVATDTILSGLQKLQKSVNVLTEGKLSSVVAGANVTVDITDPQNPKISATGADFAGTATKNPPVNGDAVLIKDSAAEGALKRVSFLNLKAFFKEYFDTLYTAAGAWLPLTGGTLSGPLILQAPGNKVLRFVRADGSRAGAVFANADGSPGVNIAVDDVAGANTKTFIFDGSGGLTVPGTLSVGGNFYVGSAQIAADGNIRGTRWGSGGVWLYDFLMSAGTYLGARAYPRRSDGSDINFIWSGQGGQPTWLWGGSDGANMYVYNPSNFRVSYSDSTWNAVHLQGWDIAGIQNDAQNRANERGFWRTRDYAMVELIPVGFTVLAHCRASQSVGAGDQVSGGLLDYSNAGDQPGGAINYGTFACLGQTLNRNTNRTTLWKRVG